MSLYGALQRYKATVPKATKAEAKRNRVFRYFEHQVSWSIGDLKTWYRDGEKFFVKLHEEDTEQERASA
jgi:hypothetical protein